MKLFPAKRSERATFVKKKTLMQEGQVLQGGNGVVSIFFFLPFFSTK